MNGKAVKGHMMNSPTIRKVCAMLLVALAGTTFLTVPSAQSAVSKRGAKVAFVSAIPARDAGANVVDGKDFLDRMLDSANKLQQYEFDYQTTVYKGSKTIDQRGHFWFKQPRLIKVEMTGSYKHGAEAVLGKDGKVRGHLGGALSPFVATVSPNSDMLRGANGYPLVDSDFASMGKVMLGFVKSGLKSSVTDKPVNVDGYKRPVYIVEVFKKDGQEIFKRAYVDQQSLLPVEWFDYNDGKLYAHTLWKNVQTNVNFKDDVFTL